MCTDDGHNDCPKHVEIDFDNKQRISCILLVLSLCTLPYHHECLSAYTVSVALLIFLEKLSILSTDHQKIFRYQIL